MFLRKDLTRTKNTFKKKIASLTFCVFYLFYTHLSESCLFLFVLICAYLCLFLIICAYLCLVICAHQNENYYYYYYSRLVICAHQDKNYLFVLICASWFMVHLDESCLFLFVLICVFFCVFFVRVKPFFKKSLKSKNGLITSLYHTTYVISLFRL